MTWAPSSVPASPGRSGASAGLPGLPGFDTGPRSPWEGTWPRWDWDWELWIWMVFVIVIDVRFERAVVGQRPFTFWIIGRVRRCHAVRL